MGYVVTGMSSDAIWKKHFLFFSKKTVFYDEKNMTSEKNTEKVFFLFFS